MADKPVFEDPRSQALLERIKRVAAKDVAVLIRGPTGSGKEIVARQLHQRSARKNGPFVVMNCGAISPNLIESELFGHVRNAFTGAQERRGYLDKADGGTLFLDEIGDLPVDQQVKLLRVLDGYNYCPVGSSQEQTSDVRFIGATNRDLAALCRDGRFREDLYNRINQIPLVIPPLAERPADIEVLARRYAVKNRPGDHKFSENIVAAAVRLSSHPDAWPGGIRNLQAFVVRAECFGIEITEEDMLRDWQRRGKQPVSFVIRAPAGRDDREHLAGLIQSKLHTSRGKPMRAASRSASMALSTLLLDKSEGVPYADLQESLESCDRRTLFNNLKPLVECGLLRDDGTRVSLIWPPVMIRFFYQHDKIWLPVSRGAIPLTQSGNHIRIEVAAQLPIEVRVFGVTHRRSGTRPRRPITGKKLIKIGQSRPIELELDKEPGFEQILVHLAWPNSRGVYEVSPASEVLYAPTPHALQRERISLIEHTGPGWVEEYLVHHT